MIFEWDEEKYFSNLIKHWVRFEDARAIWMDPFSIEYFDVENSGSEDRYVRIGMNPDKGLFFVDFCERDNGNIVRIISARKTNASEREAYER